MADAARNYEWPRLIRILDDHPDCVNASRPGGRARYAPLHQAAHGGAPASVVRRLLDLGAWRTLRTRRGERPVDVARRRRHDSLIPLLTPVYRRRRVPHAALERMQRHLHAVIREHPAGQAACLRLPEIEPLLETDRERVYFEVPGMFGGFEYWLEDDRIVPRLLVKTFRRIIDRELRYEITPRGWRIVDDSDNGGPEFRPIGESTVPGPYARRARRSSQRADRSTNSRVEPPASASSASFRRRLLEPMRVRAAARPPEPVFTGAVKSESRTDQVKLPSGREVDKATYDRFSEPLEVTLVAGPEKTALVFTMDQFGLPWKWETPQGVLEECLRNFDEGVYRHYLRDHYPARLSRLRQQE